MVHVTIWNEYHCEKENSLAEELYPSGIHNFIANFLTEHGHITTTATLDAPEHGLSSEVLDNTDEVFSLRFFSPRIRFDGRN